MKGVKNQFLFMLIYGGLLSIIFLIPDALGVEIASDGIFWDIEFYLPLTIYLICFLSFILSTVIFMSFKVLKSISNPDILKKFKAVLLLIFVYFYTLLGIVITNFINDTLMTDIFYISQVVIVAVVVFFFIAFYKGLPVIKRKPEE